MKRRTLIEMAGLAIVYAAAASAGLELDAVSGFASLVWPPTGLCLAVLAVRGPHLWPGVALGAVAANLWAGAPLPAALGIALGNTLEALAGSWVLRRLPGFRPSLERVTDTVTLIVACAVASTLLSASIGTSSLWLVGRIAPAQFAATFSAWWVGDGISALVLAPLLLVWSQPASARLEGRRGLEAVLLFASIAVVGAFVFSRTQHVWQQAYFFFPLLIWAAVRFGARGAATSTFMLSAIAIWGTARGSGPFGDDSLHQGLFELETFIGVCAATFLMLGAASAERRRALDDRERLISIASHELRTPLAALQMMLHRFKRTAGSAENLAAVAALQAQANRIASLIDGLLEVSRITAGRLKLELERVDLANMGREIVSRFADDAAQSGASITVSAPAELWGQWDRLRLEQVLSNLVSNALKYGEGRAVEIALSSAPGRARVEVTDHGEGIAKEDQARIFEPFERLATVPHHGGFGLGLWIVRQIVDALGGTIAVRSELGRGATFTVELPIEGERPVEPVQPPAVNG